MQATQSFGKRTKAAKYNASATETLAQACERAKSPEARDAFYQVAQWAGWNTIATAELRKNAADIMMRKPH